MLKLTYLALIITASPLYAMQNHLFAVSTQKAVQQFTAQREKPAEPCEESPTASLEQLLPPLYEALPQSPVQPSLADELKEAGIEVSFSVDEEMDLRGLLVKKEAECDLLRRQLAAAQLKLRQEQETVAKLQSLNNDALRQEIKDLKRELQRTDFLAQKKKIKELKQQVADLLFDRALEQQTSSISVDEPLDAITPEKRPTFSTPPWSPDFGQRN